MTVILPEPPLRVNQFDGLPAFVCRDGFGKYALAKLHVCSALLAAERHHPARQRFTGSAIFMTSRWPANESLMNQEPTPTTLCF
ncbi:MAG: hypothetical protein NTY01_01750 [Verrucomicrobia bacterium]|nr:hypothetical protein [Verrucomicrobiota bacterium]